MKSIQYNTKWSVFLNCQYVARLPYSERCEYVKKTKDCAADEYRLFDSFYWTFCHFSEDYQAFGLLVPLITMILIFVTRASIADGYVCTNLAVISKYLRLPDSIAGVTLLAMGNGIPDLFTAFAGADLKHPEILFAGATGAGLFDCSLAAGSVIFIRPFYIDTHCWWTQLFYLICYTILFCGFYFMNLSLWHIISILIAYALYTVLTGLQILFDRLEPHASTNSNLSQTIPEIRFTGRGTWQNTVELVKVIEKSRTDPDLRRRLTSTRSADFGYSWHHPKHMFGEFFDEINFTRSTDWKISKWWGKLFMLLQLPWTICLKLVIPAVVPDLKHNDGWCKLLAMINLFIFPNLVMYCFEGIGKTIANPLKVWHLTLAVGTLMSLFIFVFTRASKQPKYHRILAYFGFFGSISMSYLLSNELIINIQAIGARLAISSSWLALTVLSLGNCITDFVSATSFSKQGMQNMGLSSLYGGPMFSSSVGLSVVLIYNICKGEPLKPFYGNMSPVGSLFLFVSLISSIIVIPSLSYEGRRALGLYLIALYIIFFMYCILMHVRIHPLSEQTT